MSNSPVAPPVTPLRCISLFGALVCAGLAITCGSKPSPSATKPGPDVWAVVDGREIRRADVEKAYLRVAQTTPTPSEEEALTAKLSVLGELIVQDLLVARAGALGLVVTDTELDAAFADRKKNMTEEAFQQELAQRSLTSADMKDGLRREMVVQKVIEREVTSKTAVSDQDITDYFNANRAQFSFPETAYRIAQIVVTPVRESELANRMNDDATSREAADSKTQMLLERLKAGTSFAQLAMEYSEDSRSAPQGGDLGFVLDSSLRKAPPLLRDAVLKSSPGSVSHVGSGGVHTLVLLIAREAAGQRDPSMPAVREGITSTLRGRKEQLLRTAFLTATTADAAIVNYLARQIVQSQGKTPSAAPTTPAKP